MSVSLEPLRGRKYNAGNNQQFFRRNVYLLSRITMKCPNCEKPTTWQDNPFRPFCSERCKMIDFGNWADETYAVPAESPLTCENAPEANATDDELVRYGGDIRDA